MPFQKGNKFGLAGAGWNKGLKGYTNAGSFKVGQFVDSNHPLWKGEQASYTAIHQWIKRKLGTPNRCELCGTEEKRKYHWSNISGNYLRDKNDWWQLCVPCHKKYDLRRLN